MNRTSRKSALFLAALGVSFAVPAVRAQTVNWAGNNSGDWNDPGNWSPTGVPVSSNIADFNNGGNGNVNITLDGTTQTISEIAFDSGAAGYTIGGTSDTLSLTGTGTIVSMGGTSSQVINSNITLNGSGTFGSGVKQMLTFGSSTPGVISIPTSATLAFANHSGGTFVINDSIQGSGANLLLASVSYTSGSTVVFAGQNTYSGTTTQASGNMLTVQIASSSIVDGSGNIISGPFGSSTINYLNSTNTPFQAVNADQIVANPIDLTVGCTFTVAATPHNLTLSGPILLTSATGRTMTDNTFGQTLTLGLASKPSTITLGTTGAANLAFNPSNNSTGTSAATLVINDIIQDNPTAPTPPDTISYNSNANDTPMGNVLINSANTYAGGTTLNGELSGTFVNALTVQVGVNSIGTPGAPTSGPFGQGPLKPVVSTTFASALPAIIEPFGADRIIGNAIDLTNGGFWVGEPSVAQDPTVAIAPHNLTFSGPITLANPGKVITSLMPAGSAVYFGLASSPSTITIPNILKLQSQASAGGGNFVINDVIQDGSPTAIGQLIAQGSAIVTLNATNTYTGGTTVAGGAQLTTATNLSNGTLSVTTGGKATVSAQSTPGATAGVTVVPALIGDSASKLDLTNNGMIVQSNTPFSAIQTAIMNGAASGFTGNGITSSLAAAVAADSGNAHKTGIGYASVSELGNPTSFLGVPITDSNSTLVRYTLDGDSNMDGVVNALDFNALATHFGTTSGGDWAQGDYNNDGSIDTNDFDLLAANYNDNIATAATSSLPADSLGAVVPEPTMMGLVGVSLLALRRRRSK